MSLPLDFLLRLLLLILLLNLILILPLLLLLPLLLMILFLQQLELISLRYCKGFYLLPFLPP